MSSKFQVGDKVQIEFTVDAVGDGNVNALRLSRQGFSSWNDKLGEERHSYDIDRRHPAIVKHTPKSIAAGDVFTGATSGTRFTIKFVSDEGTEVVYVTDQYPSKLVVCPGAPFLSSSFTRSAK